MSSQNLKTGIKVPVIMYHSIGLEKDRWLWRHLSMPVGLFEDQIKTLSKNGFTTINLTELFNYRKYNNKIPEKSIVLTFDDGYLDNWVYAFPILKKYRMTGTIFVNPEFVDPAEEYRPNLEDLWRGKSKEDDLICSGFLSWREMQQMEAEQVMDIQSHSMSHTWFFCGDEIVDFHHPGNRQYPWLYWNAKPERKCYYLNENQESFVPYGTPIYIHGRSLGIRRYFEDQGLNNYLAAYVQSRGRDFFSAADWRSRLYEQVKTYKCNNAMRDRYETDEEQEERFRYELIVSKNMMEDKLEKTVEFLCWAGGALTDKALSISKEAGYLSSTLLYNDTRVKNTYGEDPGTINRTGCVSEFSRRNRFISFTTPGHFLANIKLFHGHNIYFWIIRLYKIEYFVRFYFIKLFNRGDRK